MLAVEGCTQLTPVEISRGQPLSAHEQFIFVLSRLAQVALDRRKKTAADDGAWFHLDTCAVCGHEQLRRVVSGGVNLNLRDAAMDLFLDRCQPCMDFGQGSVAIADRQEREVDVDGEPRHIVVEEIDGGPTLQCKFADLRDCGQATNQQVRLGSIGIADRHDLFSTVAHIRHN